MSYESTSSVTETETASAPAEEQTHMMRRVASDAYSRMQRFEQGMEDCIRRNPVSSTLVAAGCGAVIGGLVVALLTDVVHSRSCSRGWARFS